MQPDRVLSYSRIAQLPLLTEKIINGQESQLFSQALEKSGVLKELEKEGPFTVFLPVDKAMLNLEGISYDEMTMNDLKQFVLAHIVKGRFYSRDFSNTKKLNALNGGVLQIEYFNGKPEINQSRMLLKNVEARNGVLHYIYPTLIRLKNNN